MQQGALEQAKETALDMLADGLSIEMISRYTKLDTVSLNELKKPASKSTKH